MKTEKFSGTMESAYGKTLPNKLTFSGTYEAYENLQEVQDAKDEPSNDEVVAFVNSKKKAAARQKAMNESLTAAGIEKPTLEDPQVQLATIIKALVASGRSEAEAIALAESTLGVKKA